MVREETFELSFSAMYGPYPHFPKMSSYADGTQVLFTTKLGDRLAEMYDLTTDGLEAIVRRFVEIDRVQWERDPSLRAWDFTGTKDLLKPQEAPDV